VTLKTYEKTLFPQAHYYFKSTNTPAVNECTRWYVCPH